MSDPKKNTDSEEFVSELQEIAKKESSLNEKLRGVIEAVENEGVYVSQKSLEELEKRLAESKKSTAKLKASIKQFEERRRRAANDNSGGSGGSASTGKSEEPDNSDDSEIDYRHVTIRDKEYGDFSTDDFSTDDFFNVGSVESEEPAKESGGSGGSVKSEEPGNSGESEEPAKSDKPMSAFRQAFYANVSKPPKEPPKEPPKTGKTGKTEKLRF